MNKVFAIIRNLIRIKITLTAGTKITNIVIGKPAANWTIAKGAITVLTFGIIFSVAI